ncbi:hypothetical protein PspLS_07020 [Pyricularia sp. CBS 133598]|nr:hypothetical protein PspLS_07020 [Pyricularia sp. CBS 133598]
MSFMPKLHEETIKWLDPHKDDVILDIGCGDGTVDVQLATILSQGTGCLHGVDYAPLMITSAREKLAAAGLTNATFHQCDATDLASHPDLQRATFTKAFSNAAMHWILRPPQQREHFFAGVRNALVPGGVFAFEMGGLGNVAEVYTAVLGAVGRRIGYNKAMEVNPWFFPDEDWMRQTMEEGVGGWKIEKMESQWIPTVAESVDVWVPLMAKKFFDAVPEEEREECIRETVELLKLVCQRPGGGFMFSYLRLKVLARKV